jgi:hypothetical protein
MSNVRLGKSTKITVLMKNKYFAKGVKDFLCGKGFDRAYDFDPNFHQWSYERGRQFAAATNGMVYKLGTTVSKQAADEFFSLYEQKVIL